MKLAKLSVLIALFGAVSFYFSIGIATAVVADLRNTIAHILEHEQHLEKANEATTQQYVVLPILRALGWNDTNLVSMEILPEWKIESKRADYALRPQRERNLVVLIECKRWDQAIGKNEEQICFYAYSGNVPLAIITNGKLWRFYLSRWEAPSLSDRIFCETNIENRESAISDLEKYLLKTNVASGAAELEAETALEESQKSASYESKPVDSKIDLTPGLLDRTSATKQPQVSANPSQGWTMERIRNSVPKEVRGYYQEKYNKQRRDLFYKRVADVSNLIEEEWELELKFRQNYCGFFLKNHRRATRISRIFGITFTVQPRLSVRISKGEAEQMERQHGCKFYAVRKDHIYYDISDNPASLRPVLEFAYKKHSKP